MPFDGEIRGGTWNAQAFFAYNSEPYRRKVMIIQQMLKHMDLLMITEAHITDWEKAAFCSSSRRAGFGIILKDSFLARFSKPKLED